MGAIYEMCKNLMKRGKESVKREGEIDEASGQSMKCATKSMKRELMKRGGVMDETWGKMDEAWGQSMKCAGELMKRGKELMKHGERIDEMWRTSETRMPIGATSQLVETWKTTIGKSECGQDLQEPDHPTGTAI